MARARITPEEALDFHREPQPGKWEVQATKPMTTQRDLSLAYSPGVAFPVPRDRATTRRRPTTSPTRATSSR